MTDPMDMLAIYREERQRQLKEEAPRKSARDIVAKSVLYWIVVAFVLY